jgi:hypothetical protein
MRAYVAMRSFGMHQISACERKNIVLVPTVTFSFPWASRWSSFDIAGTHRSLSVGSFISLLYLVMVSLVIGWTTPLHTLSMPIVCQNWSDKSTRFRGMVYVGGALKARFITW